MRDPNPPANTRPQEWRDALAALPLETPDGDVWPRLAARLPIHGIEREAAAPVVARHPHEPGGRRRRAWIPLAAAAGLAALVMATLPGILDRVGETGTRPSTARVDASPPSSERLTIRPPGEEVARHRPAVELEPAGAAPGNAPIRDPAPRAITADRHAGVTPAPPVRPAASGTTSRQPAPTGEAFDRRYAESARLEAMVALVRDDGMASASGAYLAVALEDRIGGIDASLTRDDLLPDERMRLWDARIDALRSLAATEVSQRMDVLDGHSMSAALVRID